MRAAYGWLSLVTMTLAAAMPAAAATEGKFPTRPVRIMVGFSPGSATDQTARTIAPKLADLWGQPVVIENRSGAGSTLANATVAQATPDGHTLLMVSASFAITAVLQKNLPYNATRDFRGVTQIGASTSALVVPPTLGVKTVQDLIALAKERPGKLLFVTSGAGSGIHMTTERFNMLAGIKVQHVAFKGQPEMLVELLAGRVHYGIPGLGPALTFIKDGRLVPLAVVTPKRSPLLPDVPAMAEVLPGYERDAAHALLVPARTPRWIVHKVNKDVHRAMDDPEVKKRFGAIGFELAPTTPEEYDAIIKKQIQIFGEVAKAAGLIAK